MTFVSILYIGFEGSGSHEFSVVRDNYSDVRKDGHVCQIDEQDLLLGAQSFPSNIPCTR